MNKNIKLAIYFLLGIILFYLMFNGNKVEGFGDDSPPAYSIAIGGEDAQPITCTKRDNTTTPHGITGENELLTGILSNITAENPIYYSSNDNQLILIQSNESICINSENSVVEQESVAWTADNCTLPNVYSSPTCTTGGDADDAQADGTEWTQDTCGVNTFSFVGK